MQQFSENLRLLRKFHHMTQAELADKSGVPRLSLSRYETGDAVPDLERSKLLAAALDVPLEKLVSCESAEHILGIQAQEKYTFGSVKVSDKGQIVIPAAARRTFGIQPGDKLLVLGDESTGITLVREEKM